MDVMNYSDSAGEWRAAVGDARTAAGIAACARGMTYEQAQNAYDRGYIGQTEWDVYAIVWRRSAVRLGSEAFGCEFDHGPELEKLAAEVAASEGLTLRPARPCPDYDAPRACQCGERHHNSGALCTECEAAYV